MSAGRGPNGRRWGGLDHGPKPLADGLDEAVRQLGGSDAGSLSAVFSRWDEIAGPALAEHSRPLRMAGEVLVVAVDQPAWATQVRMLSSSLLERVGEIAGRVPSRLEVVVRHMERGPHSAP